MNIIICGAGDIGSHAAEVLAAKGTRLTVIDVDHHRLRAVADRMDVATYLGNCARAEILIDAGGRDADLVLAATDSDEVNLLCASLAKGIGARRTMARVHHAAYFDQRGFAYQEHFAIDRLVCPEYETSLAIARVLRNPGTIAIEGFARGAIEMQEFPVSRGAPAVGRSLMDIPLPKGTRLAVITRKGGSFVPEGTTKIEQDDAVILVGNADVFPAARKVFHDDKRVRQRVVLMGGTPMAVWLSRTLRDRDFAIRLFETDRARAEELAEKLSWVTVLEGDPTDRSVFDDEYLGQADAFITLMDDDEANIIAGVLAKLRGVPMVITVVQQAKYLDVIYDIGIDKAFSPRIVAANEIEGLLDEGSLRHLGSLAAGVIDIYRVRVGDDAPVAGKALRDITLSPHWVVAAIQRGKDVAVPAADHTVERGDTLLMVGRHGRHGTLRKPFAAR